MVGLVYLGKSGALTVLSDLRDREKKKIIKAGAFRL